MRSETLRGVGVGAARGCGWGGGQRAGGWMGCWAGCWVAAPGLLSWRAPQGRLELSRRPAGSRLSRQARRPPLPLPPLPAGPASAGRREGVGWGQAQLGRAEGWRKRSTTNQATRSHPTSAQCSTGPQPAPARPTRLLILSLGHKAALDARPLVSGGLAGGVDHLGGGQERGEACVSRVQCAAGSQRWRAAGCAQHAARRPSGGGPYRTAPAVVRAQGAHPCWPPLAPRPCNLLPGLCSRHN